MIREGLEMVREKIVRCVKKLSNVDVDIEQTTSLNVYGIDSLKRVQLVIELEAEFDFAFNDEDLTQQNFETIENIQNLLERYGLSSCQ